MNTLERKARNESLAVLMRGGDLAARNDLIEENLWIPAKLAGEFVTEFPGAAYLREDLVSVGNVALCGAADLLETKDAADVTVYLSSYVRHAIKDAYAEDASFGPVARTTRRKRKARKAALASLDADSIDGEVDLDNPELAKQEPLLVEPSREYLPDLDVIDELGIACETDQERKIVELRLSRMTETEIGDELGLSQPTISRMRKAIEERYSNYCLGV